VVPRPRDPGESTEPLPPSDADLIAAGRAGDAAAYDSLYRRHVAAIVYLASPPGKGELAGQPASISSAARRQGSASAEAWVTEVLDVANAL
jgi:hypothetical protein